ncbi:MAG: LysR family transcriptional regulator [Ignavibacteriota bacterium]
MIKQPRFLMELYSLHVFLTVATERSFSRAAEKLLRTQPAVSLSLQRLEQELGEKLIDRSGKDLILTDAGRTVLAYARRFESLQQELDNSLAELRDNSAGRFGDRRQRVDDSLPAAAYRAISRNVPKGKGAGAAQFSRARSRTSCWTATWNWA